MGLKITHYSPAMLYPIDNAHPDETEYGVFSDISGDEINEDEIWEVDGDICSEEEMLDIFYDSYVSEVEDEEEYQKGKQLLIGSHKYQEKDFDNHPNMLKVYNADDDYDYVLEDDFSPIMDGYLPDDFKHLDISDLEFDDDDYYHDDGDF